MPRKPNSCWWTRHYPSENFGWMWNRKSQRFHIPWWLHKHRERLGQGWRALNSLSKLWKSNVSKKVKIKVFKQSVERILLYGSDSWTLTKSLAKSLDGKYIKMLRVVCNIPPLTLIYYNIVLQYNTLISNKILYGNLPSISTVVRRGRLALAGHVSRRDEPASQLLMWSPDSQRKVGRPCSTVKSIIMEDTGLLKEELINIWQDRDAWKRIVIASPTRWVGWSVCMYVFVDYLSSINYFRFAYLFYCSTDAQSWLKPIWQIHAIFTKNQVYPDPSNLILETVLTSNDQPLERVEFFEIPGVRFNQHLSRKDHINYVTKSCFATIIKSLNWIDYKKYKMQQLGLRYKSTRKLKWLPIVESIELSLAKTIHKAINDKNWPSYLPIKVSTQRYREHWSNDIIVHDVEPVRINFFSTGITRNVMLNSSVNAISMQQRILLTKPVLIRSHSTIYWSS